MFFEHIFGDMVEIAYDYFTLLLKNPYQPLPVLLLVSKEKQTGKSETAVADSGIHQFAEDILHKIHQL